jgi:hypothetical protein
MKRRLGSFTLALLLATGVLGAIPASALAAYNGPCTGVNSNHLYAATLNVPNINFVTGYTKVRFLNPCTLVAGIPGSASLVMVANLQSSSTTATNIVQIGYGIQSGDAAPKLWYTPLDNTGGGLSLATWYPYNLVVGDIYSMHVANVKAQGNQRAWRYVVSHYPGGGGSIIDSAFTQTPTTWNSGSFQWWGFEGDNVKDAVGVPAFALPSQPAQIWNMGYGVWGQGSTPYRGAGICSYRRNPQSYWHCDSASVAFPNDAISGWTADH